MRKCVVCGIRESTNTEPIFFSSFPLDVNRCRKWVQVVGNEDYVYVPIEKLHQSRFICEKHFEKEDFGKKKKRLKQNAVPKLFLTANPLTDSQMAKFPFPMARTSVRQLVPSELFQQVAGLPLHKFPNPKRDMTLFSIWLTNIQSGLSDLASSYVFCNRRVCHKHFEKKYHYPEKRLCSTAIPTLHLGDKDVTQEMPDEDSSGNDNDPPPTQTPTNKSAVKSLTGDQTCIESLQRTNAAIRSHNEDKTGDGIQTEADINKTAIDNISENDNGDLYCSVSEDHDYDERAPSTASQFLRNFTVGDVGDDLQDYCRSCLANNALDVSESLSTAFTQATGVALSDARYPRRLCCRCAAYVRKFMRFRDASRMAGDMLKKTVERGMVTNSLITSIRAVCSTYMPELEIKHNFTDHFDAEYLHEEEQIKFDTLYDIENQNYFSLDTLQNNDNYIDDGEDDIIVIQNKLLDDISEQQNIEPNIINKSLIDIQNKDVPIKAGAKIVNLKAVTNKMVIDQLRQKVNLNIVPFNKELKLCQQPTLVPPVNQHGVRNSNVQNDSSQTQRPRRKITQAERERRVMHFKKFFKIVTLTFQQQMEDLFKRKETPNYIGAKFKCKFCFKGFLFKKRYLTHLKTHSLRTGPFQCTVCRKRFSSEQKYFSHQRAHNIKMRCRICSYETTNRSAAMLHLDWHNDIRYTCDKCAQIFKYKSELQKHTRIKHPSDCVCVLCGQSFVSQRAVATHMYCIHKLDNVEIPSDGPRCSECDVRFVNDDALLTHLKVSPRHMESRNEDGTYEVGDGGPRKRQPVTCELCNTTLHSISQYAAHFKEQHPGRARAQYLRTVLCHLCGKTCPTSYKLSIHMNTHTQAVTYTCDYCGRTHTNRFRFVRHIKSHQAVPHSCPICQKTFKSYSNMCKHKQLHSHVRNAKCQYCEKSFKEKKTLKYHIDYVHFHKPRPQRKSVLRDADNVKQRTKCKRTQQDGIMAAVVACTEGVMEIDQRLLEREEYVTEIGEQVVIGYEPNDDFEGHSDAVLLEEEGMHSPSLQWS